MPVPVTIQPLAAPAHGTWSVPGSKSITNRALVLAALGSQPCRLSGMLRSDDTRHMGNALRAMGIDVVDHDATTTTVTPAPFIPPSEDVFVGNSGTTVRFLSGVAAMINGNTRLVGDDHMAKRPITPLVDALRELGLTVTCPTGCPPLTITSTGTFPGGTTSIPGSISSQYFSALAMAGTRGSQPLTLSPIGNLVSRPYLTMTESMINTFGGQANLSDDDILTVQPGISGIDHYHIEPDASTASYPLALAAASGGRITVPNLDRSSLQGDVGFIDVLAQMGAQIDDQGQSLTVQGPQQLQGVDVDMHHISDTVMTVAAIAPLANGPTTIRNIANIRVKETDRLAALVNELTRLGQQVDHGEDWIRIEPKPITPAQIECYADHRIAMSFAILGLCAPGVTILDPDCVAKTYPGFWDDLAQFRTTFEPTPSES